MVMMTTMVKHHGFWPWWSWSWWPPWSMVSDRGGHGHDDHHDQNHGSWPWWSWSWWPPWSKPWFMTVVIMVMITTIVKTMVYDHGDHGHDDHHGQNHGFWLRQSWSWWPPWSNHGLWPWWSRSSDYAWNILWLLPWCIIPPHFILSTNCKTGNLSMGGGAPVTFMSCHLQARSNP